MRKAVIFDLDGTLADTLQSIAFCANRALADFGFRGFYGEESKRYKRFVGNGARMLIARALRAAGDSPGTKSRGQPDADGCMADPLHLEEVYERYLQYFRKDCMYQVTPYEGILPLLCQLREKGVKTAVLSNKPHLNTQKVVTSLFGQDTFDEIWGQTDELPPKPAPDGVYRILDRLQASKEETLYVGDSCVDMDTGRAAGVKTVGVLWGFREKQELLDHGAQMIIAKPKELLLCL